MAAQRFYTNILGKMTAVLALVTSAGAADAGKVVCTGDNGRLHSSLMAEGFGDNAKVIPAYEGLAAGDFVNEFSDGGTLKVRKADATTAGKEADGYVLAAVTTGANATVYPLTGSNTQLTGLTVGSTYYLSTTAGGVTTTPPDGGTYPGVVIQKLGKAVTSTEMIVSANDPYYIAA